MSPERVYIDTEDNGDVGKRRARGFLEHLPKAAELGIAQSSTPTIKTIMVLQSLTLVIPLMLFSLADAKGQGTKQFQTSDPRTEEAVIARDEQWLAAEISGNTAYLDGLLLPEYRSLGPDGRIHDKIAILASARNNKGSSEKAASIAKWTANHPYIRSASLIGDIAIVTFTLNKIAAPKSVLSCDIFLYQDGRWRGLYSHSTDAAK